MKNREVQKEKNIHGTAGFQPVGKQVFILFYNILDHEKSSSPHLQITLSFSGYKIQEQEWLLKHLINVILQRKLLAWNAWVCSHFVLRFERYDIRKDRVEDYVSLEFYEENVLNILMYSNTVIWGTIFFWSSIYIYFFNFDEDKDFLIQLCIHTHVYM